MLNVPDPEEGVVPVFAFNQIKGVSVTPPGVWAKAEKDNRITKGSMSRLFMASVLLNRFSNKIIQFLNIWSKI